MENNNLPKIVEWNDFRDFNKYINHLYSIFKKDFIESQPFIFGKKVILGNQKIIDGKENVFWHITTEGGQSYNNRIPDFKRSEKLPWIRFIIDSIDYLENLFFWEKVEKNKEVSLYLFLHNEDFVVILRKKKNCFILVTAFYVLYKRKKDWLLKDYNKYKKAKSVQK